MMAAATEEHNVLSPLRHTHTCSRIRYDTKFLSSMYVKMLQNDILFNMLPFGCDNLQSGKMSVTKIL